MTRLYPVPWCASTMITVSSRLVSPKWTDGPDMAQALPIRGATFSPDNDFNEVSQDRFGERYTHYNPSIYDVGADLSGTNLGEFGIILVPPGGARTFDPFACITVTYERLIGEEDGFFTPGNDDQGPEERAYAGDSIIDRITLLQMARKQEFFHDHGALRFAMREEYILNQIERESGIFLDRRFPQQPMELQELCLALQLEYGKIVPSTCTFMCWRPPAFRCVADALDEVERLVGRDVALKWADQRWSVHHPPAVRSGPHGDTVVITRRMDELEDPRYKVTVASDFDVEYRSRARRTMRNRDYEFDQVFSTGTRILASVLMASQEIRDARLGSEYRLTGDGAPALWHNWTRELCAYIHSDSFFDSSYHPEGVTRIKCDNFENCKEMINVRMDFNLHRPGPSQYSYFQCACLTGRYCSKVCFKHCKPVHEASPGHMRYKYLLQKFHTEIGAQGTHLKILRYLRVLHGHAYGLLPVHWDY